MEIHLFIQEGCRPCTYAKTQLNKCEGWEDVITITDAKVCGEWTEFAEQCGITATPTLVALQDSKVVARIAGSNQMTTDFWKATINKHKNNVTRT
jgi:hypothetical protein